MNRLEHIRDEEKKYHEHCYDNYKLFEPAFPKICNDKSELTLEV
jgi:hypothetical protein